MNDTFFRPLHTTGRTSSRMTPDEVQNLRQKLAIYAPTDSFWQHQNVELEIGIGNGLALYQRAKANPQGHYLGTEVYLNGLDRLAREVEKNPLPNLKILNQDGRQTLASIAPASLSRLLVLFPDPWPKSRHHKRRIIQPSLLDAAARALKPNGEFWLVTDWPDYAFHGIATFYNHPAFTLVQTNRLAADCKPAARLLTPQNDDDMENISENLTNSASANPAAAALGPHVLAQAPAWWQPTKYQQKAQVSGRAPWFICALKNKV